MTIYEWSNLFCHVTKGKGGGGSSECNCRGLLNVVSFLLELAILYPDCCKKKLFFCFLTISHTVVYFWGQKFQYLYRTDDGSHFCVNKV